MTRISKFAALFSVVVLCIFTSCTSIYNIFNPDHTVRFEETPEEVLVMAEKYEKDMSYQKKFTAFDSLGKNHTFIIYDDSFLKFDGRIYAYRYKKRMMHSLSLNILGTETNVHGSEKTIGFTGYMTSVEDPELTVGFIYSKDIFAKKHYRSQYDAAQIPGIGFAGIGGCNEGYIDINGRWKEYTWRDYYEEVFGTCQKDIKRKMYVTFEKV